MTRRRGSAAWLLVLVAAVLAASGLAACTGSSSPGARSSRSAPEPVRNTSGAATLASPASEVTKRIEDAKAALAKLPKAPAGELPARTVVPETPPPDPEDSVCNQLVPPKVDSTAPPADGTVTISWENDKAPQPNGLSIGIESFDVASCKLVLLAMLAHLDPTEFLDAGYSRLKVAVGPHTVFRCSANRYDELWIGPGLLTDGFPPSMCAGRTADPKDDFDHWEIMRPTDSLFRYGRCVDCDFSGQTLRDVDLRGTPPTRQADDDDFNMAFHELPWPASISKSDFTDATLVNVDLSQLALREVSFRGATIVDSSFEGSYIEFADFSHTAEHPTALARVTMPALTYNTNFNQTLMGDLTFPDAPNPTFAITSPGIWGCTTFAGVVAVPEVGVDLTARRFYDSAPEQAYSDRYDCAKPFDDAVIDMPAVRLSGKGSGPTLAGAAPADGADLSGAVVRITPADRGVLAGLDLSGARLAGMRFVGGQPDLTLTRLAGAVLDDLDLSHVRFAPLRPGAAPDLSGVSARRTNLTGALLAGANLQGANLAGARMGDADLRGATFAKAHLSEAGETAARLPGAFLAGADFSNAIANGVDFSGALISAADGATVSFLQAELVKADFQSALLAGADFEQASLDGAQFQLAVCADCRFNGAKLAGAQLMKSYLPGARLDAVQTWDDADLRGARVSEQQGTWTFALPSFAGAVSRGYGRTTLPTGGTAANIAACPDGHSPEGSICEKHRSPVGAGPYPVTCRVVGAFRCPATIRTWDVGAGVTAVGGAHSATTGQSLVVGTTADGPVLVLVDPSGSSVIPVGDQGMVSPAAVAAVPEGGFVVADPGAHRVFRVVLDPDTGEVQLGAFLGDGTAGDAGDGGPADAARVTAPSGIWVDPAGLVYVADAEAAKVRQVGFDGTVSTVAADGLVRPTGLSGDRAGNLYIADPGAHRVFRRTPSGEVAPYLGTGQAGVGQACQQACDPATVPMAAPTGVAVVDVQTVVSTAAADPFSVLVTDADNGTVRLVNSIGKVEQAFAGVAAGGGQPVDAKSGQLATAAAIGTPTAIWSDPGSDLVYVVDAKAGKVYELVLDGSA